MLRFASVLLFLAWAHISAAQHPILNYFNVNRTNNEVHLSWEVASGSQCDGIQIYRSSDSLNFIEIGEIAGICGNPDFAQPYSHVDNSPVENAYNTYKLKLGTQGYSSTVTIHYIQANENGYSILPHPANTESILYFDNPNQEGFTLNVYEISGSLVHTSSWNSNAIPLEILQDLSGLYLMQLTSDDATKNIVGKFLINPS